MRLNAASACAHQRWNTKTGSHPSPLLPDHSAARVPLPWSAAAESRQDALSLRSALSIFCLLHIRTPPMFCFQCLRSRYGLVAFSPWRFSLPQSWSLRSDIPISLFGRTRRCGHVMDAKPPKVISGRMLTKRNIYLIWVRSTSVSQVRRNLSSLRRIPQCVLRTPYAQS